MRFAGIDYGKKRVGVALSSEDGSLAFPKCTILNDSTFLEKLVGLLREEKVTDVVLGESKDFNGIDNTIMKDVRMLTEQLVASGFKTHLEPEFMTSMEAEKVGTSFLDRKDANSARKIKANKVENIDEKAATIILQSFLDRNRKS